MSRETDALTPLLQSEEFGRALYVLGAAPIRLGDGALVLRRRFRAGPGLAMLPRARIDQTGKLAGQLCKAGLGRAIVIVSPDHPCPRLARFGALPVLTAAHVAELNLGQGPRVLRAGLHQKWRNRMMHAGAQGLHIVCAPLPDNPEHWLLVAETGQQAQRGYRAWPAEFTVAYARANPGKALLFTALRGGEAVAAMLFLRHGAAATYHIGLTTPRGRRCSAHNLIMWSAVEQLSQDGCRLLDLGLIDTCAAPGLARFKLGTGAAVRPLGGSWVLWPPIARLFTPLDRAGAP